jgi:hypothetical protein
MAQHGDHFPDTIQPVNSHFYTLRSREPVRLGSLSGPRPAKPDNDESDLESLKVEERDYKSKQVILGISFYAFAEH